MNSQFDSWTNIISNSFIAFLTEITHQMAQFWLKNHVFNLVIIFKIP